MNNDGWWKKITLIGLSYLFFITKLLPRIEKGGNLVIDFEDTKYVKKVLK